MRREVLPLHGELVGAKPIVVVQPRDERGRDPFECVVHRGRLSAAIGAFVEGHGGERARHGAHRLSPAVRHDEDVRRLRTLGQHAVDRLSKPGRATRARDRDRHGNAPGGYANVGRRRPRIRCEHEAMPGIGGVRRLNGEAGLRQGAFQRGARRERRRTGGGHAPRRAEEPEPAPGRKRARISSNANEAWDRSTSTSTASAGSANPVVRQWW